jgi:hypothetical protein
MIPEIHNRSVASGDRVVAVTVDDRHARAVTGILERNCCGGITYKFCARVEMMSSVAD